MITNQEPLLVIYITSAYWHILTYTLYTVLGCVQYGALYTLLLRVYMVLGSLYTVLYSVYWFEGCIWFYCSIKWGSLISIYCFLECILWLSMVCMVLWGVYGVLYAVFGCLYAVVFSIYCFLACLYTIFLKEKMPKYTFCRVHLGAAYWGHLSFTIVMNLETNESKTTFPSLIPISVSCSLSTVCLLTDLV